MKGNAMNTELLNAIQNMLINFANENAISLADEFGTREKFAQFVFSFTIKSVVDICGLDAKTAYDFVMGDGAFAKLADDCWQQLNAVAA